MNIIISNAKAEAAQLEAEGEAEYMRKLAEHGLDVGQADDDDLPKDKCLLEFGNSVSVMMDGQFALPLRGIRE